MSSKITKNATAKPAKEGTAYISFNRDEWAALQKLGFRERWAYAQLKWLANFKTGMVGNFRKQRLSYQDIASLVTAPGIQGRGMGNIDDTQAADFLPRLAAVGLLVQHPNRPNGGLLLELPLSPINRKPMALAIPAPVQSISPNQPGRQESISPDDEVPPFDEIAMATPVCDDAEPSLSVLALTKLKNNTVEQPPACAEVVPLSRATGAAAALENPASQPQAAAPLTARQIQHAVSGDWTFTQTDSPEALALYASWAEAGINLDDLHGAMTSLGEDPDRPEPTPANLKSRLWPKVVNAWERQLAA
ncbi:hypothetical protein SAMN05518669_101806 [Variovorax sp. YR634]|uniref:hypothetical protein n=1 Tax=Variovorax sp. YR634 TaxID=1884385 RepID=UPI000896D2A4|nr:hypothetical protein [Variovorax sp. YR634]SDW50108.1 hypothetical protein SAMN05518669_101806 [Variovorax sp. YR634]